MSCSHVRSSLCSVSRATSCLSCSIDTSPCRLSAFEYRPTQPKRNKTPGVKVVAHSREANDLLIDAGAVNDRTSPVVASRVGLESACWNDRSPYMGCAGINKGPAAVRTGDRTVLSARRSLARSRFGIEGSPRPRPVVQGRDVYRGVRSLDAKNRAIRNSITAFSPSDLVLVMLSFVLPSWRVLKRWPISRPPSDFLRGEPRSRSKVFIRSASFLHTSWSKDRPPSAGPDPACRQDSRVHRGSSVFPAATGRGLRRKRWILDLTNGLRLPINGIGQSIISQP